MMRLVVQDLVDDSGSAKVGCTIDKLPFMKMPGAQSAQAGPVFKLKFNPNSQIIAPL
jgi:hypothetical protein